MAEQNVKKVVSPPKAGETVIIKGVPGQDIVLDVAFEQVDPRLDGSNVIFEFPNGGKVILDFADLEGPVPNVVLSDGTVLSVEEFLASLGGQKEAALQGEGIEPAAGPAAGGATSGGVGEYGDDAGDLIDGVDKLGGLDPRDFPDIVVEPIDARDDEEPDGVPTLPEDELITVEEGSIPGIGGNIDDPNYSPEFSGTFADNANWGPDGFGGIVSVNGVTPVGGVITVNGAGFTLVVDAATGAYTYTQTDNILQGNADNGQNSQTGPTFAIVAQDGNGTPIGFNLVVNVLDDLPQADLKVVAEAGVVLDETKGGEGAFDDDVSGNPFNSDWGTPIGLVSGEWVVDASGSKFGADSEEATKAISLVIEDSDSGLRTTAGEDITLYAVGNGVVIGQVGEGEDARVIFAISINNDGELTVAQYESLEHGNINSNDEPVNLDGKLSALVTVIDGDGDVSTASVGIGAGIVFEDDGPTVSANAAVQLDDDALAGGNPGGTGDVSPDTANTSGTLGFSYGADGAGSVQLLDTGAPAGFTYEKSGDNLLIKQGGVTVITVTLNTTTGAYVVTQNAAIDHPAGGNENDVSFTLNYRVTDGDGDTIDGTLAINVDDDTPTGITPDAIFIENKGTVGLADQYSSNLNFDAGADGVGSVKFNSTDIDAGAPVVSLVPGAGTSSVIAKDDAGNDLMVGGQKLYLYLSADGTTLTASTGTTAGGTVGFTLTLNGGGGLYTFNPEAVISNGTEVTATNLTGIGGGNPSFKLLLDVGGTTQDVAMTTRSTDSVNSDQDDIGISQGQTFSSPELIRFDLVNGLAKTPDGQWFTYDGTRNEVVRWNQQIQITGNVNQRADLKVTAINAANNAGDTTFYDAGFGGDTIIDLDESNIRIYNAAKQLIDPALYGSLGIIVDDYNGSSVSIFGLRDDWYYEVVTDDAHKFDAIQVEALPGTDTFSLGFFTYGTDFAGDPIELSYNIIGMDGDGDAVYGTVDVSIFPDAYSTTGSNLTGSAGDDVLLGTTGGDIIQGADGNDFIAGNSGHDFLFGGSGHDVLHGGSGNDTLVGGVGDDTMTGGSGSDTFKFNPADIGNGVDEITDFHVAALGEDGDVLDFTGVLSGTDPLGAYFKFDNVVHNLDGTVTADLGVDTNGLTDGSTFTHVASVTMTGVDAGADGTDILNAMITNNEIKIA